MPEAFALETRFGKIVVPLLSRMEVGSNRRISFAKADRRVEGDREVVTKGRGSMTPERCAYSSSIARASAVDGAVSSYL